MQERRKFKRRYLMFYSRVFDMTSGELVGYLSDLTPEGTMLISEFPAETGYIYSLRMDLPEGDFNKNLLFFDAKCVWCKRDPDPHFYNTGFQLINISELDTDIIEQMIEDYGFRENE